MAVRLSAKYQVVIPEHVRATLQLSPGMEIDVIAKDGIAYLVPVRSVRALRATLAGKLDQQGLRDKRDRPL